jgi:hypothetical protein
MEPTMSNVFELRPEEALKGGLTLPEAERKEAALALAEQLRADGVPADALGLWVSIIHAALDAGITGQSLERLRIGLQRIVRTPHFSAWADTLLPLLVDTTSVEAALELVVTAYKLRLLNDALLSRS